jgi:hypothetical protein
MNRVLRYSKRWFQEFVVFPWYILSHPFDGFYELKYGGKGLLKVATLYLVLESTMSILQFRYTGFLFNTFNQEEFNYIRQILLSLLPLIVFVIANWSITTLMDGKGKFKDIYLVVGYALFLKVYLSLFAIVLSNVLTIDEAFFYYGVQTLGFGILIAYGFLGILVVHEYTLTKTFLTIGLTMVSAGLIIFLSLLAFSLMQQIYVFIITIYRELSLRI